MGSTLDQIRAHPGLIPNRLNGDQIIYNIHSPPPEKSALFRASLTQPQNTPPASALSGRAGALFKRRTMDTTNREPTSVIGLTFRRRLDRWLLKATIEHYYKPALAHTENA